MSIYPIQAKPLIILASIVDERMQPSMRKHSIRVEQLVSYMCNFMGIDNWQIVLAARLHDIGKASIPAELLNRKELSDSEFERIKLHPVIGYDAIDSMGFHSVAVMVRQHHERCDGSGYPDHLKCDEITEGARIISVADVFDAIVSKRSYKDSIAVKNALSELDKNTNTLFWKPAVDVLHSVVLSQIFSIEDVYNGVI